MEVIIQELSRIIIPECRHRKTIIKADIEGLATSILTYGLFHAPVVLTDGVTLVMGKRRLLAIANLYEKEATFFYNGVEIDLGHIPIVKITANSELEIRKAELAENIDRVSLSWREKGPAVEELDRLREDEEKQVDVVKDGRTMEGKLTDVSDSIKEDAE